MPPSFRTGCSGWGYDDWRGGFYAASAKPAEYLEAYARVFDTVEVDSTFYQAPSRERVAAWAQRTPDQFTFLLKVPQEITHARALRGVDEPLSRFLLALEPLREANKLGPLLAQFPASFTRMDGAGDLAEFVRAFPRDVRLAVELRHASWWAEETYGVLRAGNVALAWSVNQYVDTPLVATADFGYARLIGDRELTRFDKVQRDRRAEIEAFVTRMLQAGHSLATVFVIANNHYMGFGPGTTQIVREVLGLPALPLTKAARTAGQRGLMDFE